VLPVTLDEPGRGTRASRSLLDFQAVDVLSASMCPEQDFKHVESRLGDALDASHVSYIT
jgi:hypothetical protein